MIVKNFIALLTLLFIGLKLTGYIAWSWFWVLSPIIISMSVGLLAIGIVMWQLNNKKPPEN